MKRFAFNIVLFIIFTFAFEEFSCTKVKDEKLSMQRRNYLGNELRTDGYYYYSFLHDYYKTERVVMECLYTNGVIRLCGSSNSIEDFENQIEGYSSTTSRSYKSGWGVFVVENDVIKYEVWRGARFLEPYTTRIYTGKILNDTTYHITESYRPNGSERQLEDYLYHFRQFSPKPDSTNKFIK